MLRPLLLVQPCHSAFCFRWMSANSKAEEGREAGSKQLLLKLRNKTGYPLISCKEALTATNFDFKEAELYLVNLAKEKGWNKMQDISPKHMCQGLVGVAKNKSSAAIVEVNCGTDFVAKTTEFQQIVKDAAEVALSSMPMEEKISMTGEEFLNNPIPGKDVTLKDHVALVIGKLRENILVRRAALLTLPTDGYIGAYIHPSALINARRPGFTLGTFAAIASLSCTNAERSSAYMKSRGRDVCQHIVGMRPLTLGEESSAPRESDSSEDDSKENRLHQPDEGSTELLKQPFLLDTDISVEQWLVMSDLRLHNFVRFQVGEPLDS